MALVWRHPRSTASSMKRSICAHIAGVTTWPVAHCSAGKGAAAIVSSMYNLVRVRVRGRVRVRVRVRARARATTRVRVIRVS